jgi:hypothetical protein
LNSAASIHYSRSFSGFVWKIKVDEIKNKLWIETRDENSYEVKLFWVDIVSAKSEEYSCEKIFNWWDNLYHVYNGQVLIQTIPESANPGPINLGIYDADSGKVQSQLDSILIQSINRNTITYTGPEGHQDQLNLRQAGEEMRNKYSVLHPGVYTESNEYYGMLQEYLHSKDIAVVGPIAYLESNDHILMSYHSREKELSRNLLWIHQDAVKMNKVIDQHMKGYSHESFFTFGEYLIYVADRKNLAIHMI